MYYTVIKHSSHLRTLEKCRNTRLRLVFSTFPSCSQIPVVFYQCNTRLRLLYLLDNSVHNILFNVKKINNFIGRKKDIDESVQNKPYFGMQIMTAETTIRTLYVHVGRRSKCCDFSTNFILFHMLDTFYLSGFFPSITLINYASSYRKI